MKRQLNETTKTQHEPAKLAREGGAGGAKRGRTMQRFTATVASLVMLLGVANYAAARGGVPPAPPAPVGCTVPLAGFGPIDPANGLPMYYQDSTGLALAQCLDTVCAGPAFVTTLPNPALPVSFPNNFPVEMFYSRAIAKTTVGAVSVLYTAALEGTFFNGVVALPGDQVVFTRVRIRVAGLQPGGLYTVTNPYGVKTFTAGGLGVVDLGEQCDDGAANGTPASCCSATCKFKAAGSPCANPNPCMTATCNGADVCVATPNTAPCNDGNACTTADVCAAGVCVGGPALSCNDANVCTTDTCDPAIGCVHTPASLPCNDGNPCTSADTCAAGACVGTPIPGCTCTPTTCAAQGKNCGTILNGCGGTLTCGTCTAPQICGGGGIANVCGPTLTLTATGRAGETVLSTPAGVSVAVGTTGTAAFAPGTSVTLSITNGRSAFWSGVCSSGVNKVPTCTFTLNANASETV